MTEEPGWHVHIWLPDAPGDEADAYFTALADWSTDYEQGKTWDAHMSAELVAGGSAPPSPCVSATVFDEATQELAVELCEERILTKSLRGRLRALEEMEGAEQEWGWTDSEGTVFGPVDSKLDAQEFADAAGGSLRSRSSWVGPWLDQDGLTDAEREEALAMWHTVHASKPMGEKLEQARQRARERADVTYVPVDQFRQLMASDDAEDAPGLRRLAEEADIQMSVARAIERSGYSLEELQAQAEQDDFPTVNARNTWKVIRDWVPTASDECE